MVDEPTDASSNQLIKGLTKHPINNITSQFMSGTINQGIFAQFTQLITHMYTCQIQIEGLKKTQVDGACVFIEFEVQPSFGDCFLFDFSISRKTPFEMTNLRGRKKQN